VLLVYSSSYYDRFATDFACAAIMHRLLRNGAQQVAKFDSARGMNALSYTRTRRQIKARILNDASPYLLAPQDYITTE